MRLLWALLALAPITLGWDAWHMDQSYEIATEELDPVVSPGAQASHMHKIFGGSGMAATYSQDTYQGSKCSSLGLQPDKSDYWVPALYWIDSANSQFIPVPLAFRWYYFLIGSSAKDVVQPFPAGLRMLAGSPNNKAAVSTRRMIFSCLNGNSVTTGTNFNFATTCPDGMQVEIYFPSCWDGINLDSSDQSHVTYSVNYDAGDGGCPMTHPVRIPTIMGEWHFNPQLWDPNTPLAGNLAWANGDTTGYGFHSDFANGWDMTKLQAALNNPACRNTTGSSIPIKDCSTFSASDYSTATASTCKPDLGVLQESFGNKDLVPIPRLPGCNPLWGATGSKPTCSPAIAGLDVSPFISTQQSTITTTPQNFVLPTTPGWQSVACINDMHSFSGGTQFYDSAMTQERCQQSCAKGGYKYAAVGLRGTATYDCECSNTWDLTSAPIAPGMCTTPCPGNSTQSCGGPYYYNVMYAPNGTVTPTSSVYANNASYVGCYSTSSTTSGLLGNYNYTFTSASMTTDVCLTACNVRGYSWAMTRNGYQCFCGSSWNYGTNSFIPDSYCNMQCNGNSTEMCGSNIAGSLYNITVSTASNAYQYRPDSWQGCYADTTGKTLANTSWTSGSAMTNEACINSCAELGYGYAGLKYGYTCYCGATFTPTTRQPMSQCAIACTGNSTEVCGGTSNIDIYTTSAAAVNSTTLSSARPGGYMGCFIDSGSSTILTSYSYTTQTMTVRTCLDACVGFGYAYGGLEGGTMCKCGNTAPTTAQGPTTVNCVTACSGNKTETCGGGGYLEAYNLTTYETSTDNSTSAYVGCFSNSAIGLKSYSIGTPLMSDDFCRTTCNELGYLMAGTMGTNCYCGDSWQGGQQLPDSSCTTVCAGNSTQKCGGSSMATVYNSAGAPALPYHRPGWLGCYTDPSGGKALSAYTYSSSGMTVHACQLACAALNYTYTGLEGGTGCYCDNALNAKSAISSGLLCAQACAGNSSELCGASNYRMDIYNSTVAVTTTTSNSTNSTSSGNSTSTTNSTSTGTLVVGTSHCYTDITTIKTLAYKSDWMSIEICGAWCSNQNYTYAGVRAGNICTCGNTAPTNFGTASLCAGACTADANENCGTSTAMVAVQVNPGGNAFQLSPNSTGFDGCFNNGVGNVLPYFAYTDSAMSQASCASNCKGLGYTLAGVHSGTNCYCGTASTMLASTNNYQIAPTDCTTACPSGGGMCGGSGKISVFDIASMQNLPASTTTEGLKGCYLPGSYLSSSPYSYTSNLGITTEVCRRTCRLKGYSIAGLTLGNNCTCSNTANYGAQAVNSYCTATCFGNSSEICGGLYAKAVSVYDTTGSGAQNPSGTDGYVGCYMDTGSTKILNSYTYTSAGMTPTLCQKQCAYYGYTVAGLERGSNCYCGSALPTTGILADSQCVTACAGVSTLYCGGTTNMAIYTLSGYGTNSSTSASASGASASANATGSASSSKVSSVSATISASASASKSSVSASASSASASKSASVTGASTSISSAKASSVTGASTSISSAKASSVTGASTSISSAKASSVTSASSSKASSVTGASTSMSSAKASSVTGASTSISSAKASSVTSSVPSSASASKASSSASASSSSSKASAITSAITSASSSKASSVTSTSSSKPASAVTSSVTSTSKASSVTSSSSSKPASAVTSSVTSTSKASSVTSSSSSSSKPASAVTSSVTSTSKASSASSAASTSKAASSITSTSTSKVSSTLSSTSSAAASSAVADATLVGCYTQPTSVFSHVNMTCSSLTPTMCKVWCNANSYTYSGVIDGNYCGCSSDISTLTAVSSTTCNTPCVGDSSIKCGGTTAVSVYKSNGNVSKRRHSSSAFVKRRIHE